ncbi:hypothetical protein ABR738_18370 [Streptomyces sp. Edi4]|uniref:hypothetical protein n=1 Tax=Streptomyces sp. Edi4 TaxID=3162527 RepID=UPI003305A119
MWLAEKLLAGAIALEDFRRIVLPRRLGGEALVHQLGAVREELVKYLQQVLDLIGTAPTVIKEALTELEYRT